MPMYFSRLRDNRGSLRKSSPPPLIVEFTGLPGAGKTTVARQVISELNGTHRLNVNGNDDVRENVASIVRFIDEIWQTRFIQHS